MMKPELLPEVRPPPPTVDMYAATLGSLPMMAATCCWCVTIESNEVPSAACR